MYFKLSFTDSLFFESYETEISNLHIAQGCFGSFQDFRAVPRHLQGIVPSFQDLLVRQRVLTILFLVPKD